MSKWSRWEAYLCLASIALATTPLHGQANRGFNGGSGANQHLAIASPAGLNPAITAIVNAVSEKSIEANLRKLESFGTRHVLSSQDDPEHGIGAAQRWIFDQLKSYSPRLEVTYQPFTIKQSAASGVLHDVQVSNVIAVLPGTMDKDRYVVVAAHYDSLHRVRKPWANDEQRLADLVRRGTDASDAKRYIQAFPTTKESRGEQDDEATAAQTWAPGVTDDGSGTAAVLELARVMSQYQFDNSVVFIAFAGEEVGLQGSKAYAAKAKQSGMDIEAVLNNDIIGSEVAGNGRSNSSVVRVFADGPEDSPARALLRYTRLIAERYVPSMKVDMIFHRDRFMRGGDHTSFTREGFAAVRLTSASENFANQHSGTDTFANTSVPYATRVTRINAAVLASLAFAPAPPVVNFTYTAGRRKGGHVPMLTRGESGYDAVLRWEPGKELDLAGYAIVIRSTTAPDWEREVWVGNVTTYTLPDTSIDDVVFGVKAIDREGNQSLVSSYLEPMIPQPPATAAASPK